MIYEYEEHRLMVPGSRSPVSPLMLIQEMVPSRWAAYVAARMCCQTGREQSHTGTWFLLRFWPTAEKLAKAHPEQVRAVIRPAGLHKMRAAHLVEAAGKWSRGWRPHFQATGYVADSDRVFSQAFNPHLRAEDKELALYLEWARSQSDPPDWSGRP